MRTKVIWPVLLATIVFTSDNGGFHAATHNRPLRGYKGELYEGGIRVPFIAKWPERIPAGGASSATMNFTDVFATLTEMLEVDLSKSYPGQAPDSYSFFPILIDPSTMNRRPPAIHGKHAIRDGDWKFIADARREDAVNLKRSQFELYNLAGGIAEQNDVSQSHTETVKRLFTEFRKFTNSRKLK